MPIMIMLVILLVAAAGLCAPLHGGGSGVYTRMPIGRVLKGHSRGTHGMPLSEPGYLWVLRGY